MMRLARFGTSAAGLVLEDLLKEHSTKSRQVNSMMNDIHDGLNFLHGAPNKRVYENMWVSWVKTFKRRAIELELPEVVRTHCINTIVGVCRQKRREYMINRGGLGKKRKKQLLKEYKTHYNDFVKKVNACVK